MTGLLRLEAPVITSVQGFAAGGGGFGLVCASDIVIAGESAKFLAGATRVAMARELAAGAPKALAATKRLVWAGTGTSIEQCLSEEARTVSELSGMADAREGLAAVIERRKPVFTGR